MTKTWNFSNPSEYVFDQDFISVNGKAELKDLDLNYDSISEFNRGTKSNLVISSGAYTIDAALNANTLDSSWAPQWNKLEVLYRMDSHSFIDSSANNRNGVVTGTPSFSSGKIGTGAASFAGAGDIVKVSGVDLSGDFTISLWVKRPDTSSDQYFLGQGTNNNLHGLHLGFRGDGSFAFAFWGNDISSNTQYLTPNQWDHFVVVYDRVGQRMRIYHNAVHDGERWGSQDYAGSGDVCIGGGLGDCSLIPGQIELDEVAIWSSALTQNEIDKIYLRQKSKFAASYVSEVINAGLPFTWNTFASLHSGATFEGRSCDDQFCAGESFSDITPGALVFPVNPFFQFKVNLEANVLPYPSFTDLDFSNGGQRFYPGKPTLENAIAFPLTKVSSITIHESGSCTPGYRLSNDGGSTWKYFNAGWVNSVDDSKVSTSSDISANASTFPAGIGSFKFRAVLPSDSSEDCVIEEIAVTP